MCMITFLTPGTDVPVSGIKNGAETNNDGHGWAVAAETGLMLTGHALDVEEALWGFSLAREAYPEAFALFHSRYGTHGTMGLSNCHPFPVRGHSGVVVAHNGILPNAFHPGRNDRRSDTAIMADEWLGRQTRRGAWSRRERAFIGASIGSGNKLAILSVSDRFSSPRGFLVNQHMGYWVNGIWYSNSQFKPVSRSYWSGGTGWASDGGYTHSTIRPREVIAIGGNSAKREEKSKPAYSPPKKEKGKPCMWCYSSNTVNEAMNVCNQCGTCQDCLEPQGCCLCWTPAESKRANSEEVNAP